MVRCLVAFGVLILVSATAHAQFDTKPEAGVAAPRLGKSQTQRWEFGVIIRSLGGPSAGLFGTFPIPADWPEQQVKVASEQISPNVRRTSFRTTDGLKQMLFDVPQLPAGETATCLLALEVTRAEQLAPTETAGLVIPKDPPKEVRKSLGPSPFIETTNTKIKALAKELTTGKETAWEQVEALCDGTRARVKFEPENKDLFRGATGALRDGKADKEDLTSLFVALCRAHKVPARMVWVLDFCYAEFYLEDAAGKGEWFPCQVHGEKQFGSMNDPRPILQKGDNFKIPEKKEPQRFVAEFLTGKGGTGGQPQVEFRRRLEAGP
ncbi:MAG: transglutaminase-like domain-containing protein [Pirellulaceae bacterium]|nr:transglutaminase-like domain-containing protein [Pirellulaceae bacterium]